jgi:hypothetical protein
MAVDQYPKDYNPPLRGKCEAKTNEAGDICGYKTKGWTTHWLDRCPKHWQELAGTR